MGEERIDTERMMQEEAQAEEPAKKRKSAGAACKFVLALFLACAAAAGLLMLLAWVSYEMRFSSEVVRAGILGLYVLPCLLGGRVLRRLGQKPAPVWGLGLGISYYAVLFALSWMEAGLQTEPAVGFLPPVLCASGGLLGGLLGKKRRPDAQKAHPV